MSDKTNRRQLQERRLKIEEMIIIIESGWGGESVFGTIRVSKLMNKLTLAAFLPRFQFQSVPESPHRVPMQSDPTSNSLE